MTGRTMKRSDLRAIVASVLEVEPEELTPEAELASFELFDSVSVLTLMIELDEKAGIKMTASDTVGLRCYGDFEKLAERQGITLAD